MNPMWLNLFFVFTMMHLPLGFPTKTLEFNVVSSNTVLEEVSREHVVKTGWVCASPLDIDCIDYVCTDDKKGKAWVISVNGDYETVNSQTRLKPSDRLVLQYASLKER